MIRIPERVERRSASSGRCAEFFRSLLAARCRLSRFPLPAIVRPLPLLPRIRMRRSGWSPQSFPRRLGISPAATRAQAMATVRRAWWRTVSKSSCRGGRFSLPTIAEAP